MAIGAVYIVEGVPGAGKDTLVRQLVTALKPDQHPVQVWDEAAVLASWHHYYVPRIDELRLDLTEALVRYVQATLVEYPETVFVFNRFHVSHAVWRMEKGMNSPELEQRHRHLVTQLRGLPVLMLHPTLTEQEAEVRTSHGERQEAAWAQFLERRARDMHHKSAGDLYLAQQQHMQTIMDTDGLPYRQISVDPGQPLDLGQLLL